MRAITRFRHGNLSWLVDVSLLAAAMPAIALIFWYAPPRKQWVRCNGLFISMFPWPGAAWREVS